ncbi:MAG: DEAD/DEAH box helicase [Myxococcota bacterium]
MDDALMLSIDPRGHIRANADTWRGGSQGSSDPLTSAFAQGVGAGLLHLAGPMLEADLSPSLAFGREIGRAYYTALCRAGQIVRESPPLPLPGDFERLLLQVPPIQGAEYANPGTLTRAWRQLQDAAWPLVAEHSGDLPGWLEAQNPAWHGVGRLYFHLAENKRDPTHPFGFVATYVDGLDEAGRPLHRTLGQALDALGRDRQALLLLLRPLELAAAASPLVARLIDAGEVYRAVRWTPDEAFAFLQQIPACESSGVLVRVPDWWRRGRQLRVKGTLGARSPSALGFEALLDFDATLALDGQPLTAKERRALLRGTTGLRLVRGRWVTVDPERLTQALEQFKAIEQAAKDGTLSFAEGMRLLSGLGTDGAHDPVEPEATDPAPQAWHEVVAGPWLRKTLQQLGRPTEHEDPGPALHTQLRGYQRQGLAWARLLCRLGLGGCLADDMGLGKTLQVLALLLTLRADRAPGPHLVVVPASLLGNWQAEAQRFAPSLTMLVAHRSQTGTRSVASLADEADHADVVLTTYGTLARVEWLRERRWGLAVLDEAQAIKNPETRQTRATKTVRSRSRLVLTGTPIENRIDDLWSLMDFACPGLLGSHTEFRTAVRTLERRGAGFSRVRRLVAPYILRRLKTDPSIVPDLPDKTEMVAWCRLGKTQAALYQQAVDSLHRELATITEVIKRRGLIFAYLQRFKQICNHPSHWLGDGDWSPSQSGKFGRLAELCEPMAARQERVLVFTQFREMTRPLERFLATIFGRPGLRLDGQTPVRRRAQLVQTFQQDDGPPFFVLSLKAGGTGLNLTAASHVVHFDRWWNPAVEDQATDRAYRIGQHHNVLVQKFVCRGTFEERIHDMITQKQALAREILSVDASTSLTEMSTDELIANVRLDLRKAVDDG